MLNFPHCGLIRDLFFSILFCSIKTPSALQGERVEDEEGCVSGLPHPDLLHMADLCWKFGGRGGI